MGLLQFHPRGLDMPFLVSVLVHCGTESCLISVMKGTFIAEIASLFSFSSREMDGCAQTAKVRMCLCVSDHAKSISRSAVSHRHSFASSSLADWLPTFTQVLLDCLAISLAFVCRA